MENEKLEIEKKINEGINLFENNKYEESIKIFEKLKENSKTSIVGIFFLGVIPSSESRNIWLTEFSKYKLLIFLLGYNDKYSYLDNHFLKSKIWFGLKRSFSSILKDIINLILLI